ncbi:hypothetical protein BBBOND_0210670 [Babesia bigemina]|uniref:Uncharacterized protein n=1 Tax=Babesia bigemina TaxID=5866 RepID=A0A061D7F9_BABBI|nr:hypothetical protein BBBOND_0210670 [Babesia bigemina]CDR95917.1 hypothetical protein BBBOND_0210670 [Babesia bigemina]|eukprot:XP_012768103.1 hypothetical protein BBBOND_0210670 [Babesia bigemina]
MRAPPSGTLISEHHQFSRPCVVEQRRPVASTNLHHHELAFWKRRRHLRFVEIVVIQVAVVPQQLRGSWGHEGGHYALPPGGGRIEVRRHPPLNSSAKTERPSTVAAETQSANICRRVTRRR